MTHPSASSSDSVESILRRRIDSLSKGSSDNIAKLAFCVVVDTLPNLDVTDGAGFCKLVALGNCDGACWFMLCLVDLDKLLRTDVDEGDCAPDTKSFGSPVLCIRSKSSETSIKALELFLSHADVDWESTAELRLRAFGENALDNAENTDFLPSLGGPLSDSVESSRFEVDVESADTFRVDMPENSDRLGFRSVLQSVEDKFAVGTLPRLAVVESLLRDNRKDFFFRLSSFSVACDACDVLGSISDAFRDCVGVD
jgi:hypothetical protein